MKALVIGLSGVTAVGTGITGYYFYSRPSKKESIKSKLSSFQLISSLSLSREEMEQQWKAEFDLDKKEIKRIIPNIEDDSKGGEALAKWCDNSLSKPANEPLLTHTKRWCTVGTIESRIGRNKTFLEDGSAEWGSRWESKTEANKREKVGLTGAKQSSSNKDSELVIIKKFCNDNRTRDFLAKEKVAIYDEVIDWCTK